MSASLKVALGTARQQARRAALLARLAGTLGRKELQRVLTDEEHAALKRQGDDSDNVAHECDALLQVLPENML